MTNLELILAVLIGASCGAAAGYLQSAIRASRLRTQCLRSAKFACEQFYDGAEKLLDNPAIPTSLKEMIFDLNLAVTDDEIGRKAAELFYEGVCEARRKGWSEPPDDEVMQELASLRQRHGELYDLFNDTLRWGFTGILMANCAIERGDMYPLNGSSRSVMLRTAEILDRVTSNWRPRPPEGGARPACA